MHQELNIKKYFEIKVHINTQYKFQLQAETRKIREEKDVLVLEVERLKHVESVLTQLR